MTSLVRRAACASLLAILPLITACASNPQPSSNIVGVAGPEILENRTYGIPDWVRTIHADPFKADRKSFGPGDVVPVVVDLKAPSQGELFGISYSTNSEMAPEATLFETTPTLYLTDPNEPVRAFGFTLKVKPAASLPNTPTKVFVHITGVEGGNPVRIVSNEFTVAR